MSEVVEEKPKTNYGACSLVVVIATGLCGWFGYQMVVAQVAVIFVHTIFGSAGHPAPSSPDNYYWLVGIALIILAFLSLIGAIALAGAGFAVNRGRAYSSLTILIVLFPLVITLLRLLGFSLII